MLIIVTIISLIKAQYQTLHTSQPANHKDIIKKTLIGFIMLFITPMIVFGGVAMSNIALLKKFDVNIRCLAPENLIGEKIDGVKYYTNLKEAFENTEAYRLI